MRKVHDRKVHTAVSGSWNFNPGSLILKPVTTDFFKYGGGYKLGVDIALQPGDIW